jgi:hypothetical protein
MACGGRSGAKDSVSNRAELNRQTRELERLVTHGKQTAALGSNRQKIKFRKTENPSTPSILLVDARRSLPRRTRTRIEDFQPGLNEAQSADTREFLEFLAGIGSQTEMAVTHLKQKGRAFLTGTRIACCEAIADQMQPARKTTSRQETGVVVVRLVLLSLTSGSMLERVHREVFDFQSRPQDNAPSVPSPHNCVRKEKNRNAKILGVSVSSCALLVR